jgi:hypothetical protein
MTLDSTEDTGRTVAAPATKAALTKDQLVSYFKRKFEGMDQRPEVSKLLYETDDFTLISEVHARMILPLVGLEVYEAAMDGTRKEPLITIWKRSYLKMMISFERKGRLEYLGALQALAMDDASNERATRM